MRRVTLCLPVLISLAPLTYLRAGTLAGTVQTGVMLSSYATQVTIRTDGESGSIGRVERISAGHLRCAVQGESDQDKRNRQANWYYFRLDGAAGVPVTIDLVDLVGEYNYRPGSHSVTKGTRPVYSYDRRRWSHFRDDQVEWDEKEIRLRLRFTPAQDRVWIAHVPPYTNQDLARLLDSFKGNPFLRVASIGKTVEGRDMFLLTVTNADRPEKDKKVIWLMLRQHSWETGTSWVGEGVLRFLLSSDPVASRVRNEAIFKILPNCDPDGVARGGVRFNKLGYDLNRNWDVVDVKRMPEIYYQRKAILDWVDAGHRLDLFLAIHNTENAEYLGGPGSPVVERFHRLLVENTTYNPTQPLREMSLTSPPDKPGRSVVAQGLYGDRKLPNLTMMEQMVEYNSKLGRPPTIDDRMEFGVGLVKAMWGAVTGSEP